MAPKRKRADEAPAAATTRATRRSTRNKAVDEAEVESVASGTTDVTMVTASEPPPPKRTRKAPSKTAKATKSNSKKSTSQIPADADGEAESTSSHADGPHDGANESASKPMKPPRPALKDPEPYSAARAHALFQAYADDEDPSVMGPEGLEQLFGDMQVSLEGAVPLVLAWLCNAEEMAKITLKEWETMTSELQISCLASLSIALHEFEDLLLTNKPAMKQSHGTPDKRKKVAPEPYDRRKYYIHSRDRRGAFKALYNFCFVLAKPQQARVIDMETGSAFWSVLLAPQYPLMQELLQFLEDRKNEYKGVNKDQWSMVYDFCLTVSPSLEGYEDDGAWPSMLDAFVEWKKSRSS